MNRNQRQKQAKANKIAGVAKRARVTHAHKNANPGRLAKLDALHAVYWSYVKTCVDLMIAQRRTNVLESERQVFFPKSALSSQLQKCARAQAVEAMGTWLKGLYPRLKGRIFAKKTGLAKEMQSQLCYIGKPSLTELPVSRKAKDGLVLTDEALALWWSWVWDTEIAGNPPAISGTLPMRLSCMCITFKPAETSRIPGGGWWASVSCLDNGKPVEIPLAATPYLLDPSKMAKTVLVSKRRGRWTFQFTESVPESKFVPTGDEIGIDVGLNVLVATSSGLIIGRRFKPKFDAQYKKVKAVRANRMRQKLPHNSPRLDRMEQRLSGMIKTEAATAAKKLVAAYLPGTTFVMENLDLRGCRGQKRFAYKAVQQAVSKLAPTKKVNPAYTSQTCMNCGYVLRRNRGGTKFKCKSCGAIHHADVVGACNVLGRSGDKQIADVENYKEVGTILRERYRTKRDSSVGRVMRAHRCASLLTVKVRPQRSVSHSSKQGRGIKRHAL